MGISFHPRRGTIVAVDFGQAFIEPEMVKKRLCIVISPPIRHRPNLCTVVPLSTTPPTHRQDYHYELEIKFPLPPAWGHRTRWVKADMLYAVGFHRVDLLRIGKDLNGKRIYQLSVLSKPELDAVGNCILSALGISPLTIQ